MQQMHPAPRKSVHKETLVETPQDLDADEQENQANIKDDLGETPSLRHSLPTLRDNVLLSNDGDERSQSVNQRQWRPFYRGGKQTGEGEPDEYRPVPDDAPGIEVSEVTEERVKQLLRANRV